MRKGGNIKKSHTAMLYEKLRQIYTGMIDRCYNEDSKGFGRYGKRGIVVCNKWRDNFIYFYIDAVNPFVQFIEDVGDMPQIDRIDSNGIYTPENCRWIDRDGNLLNSTAWGDPPIDDRYKDLTYKFENHDKLAVLDYLHDLVYTEDE